MTFLKTTAAAVAVMAMSGFAASAATFDFGADAEAYKQADSNNYEGTFDQVYPGGATDGAVTVNATAFIAGSDTEAHAFMDGFDDGRPAGLGVCSSGFIGDVSGCSSNLDGGNAGDDNLVFEEVLQLTFSGGAPAFSIDSLTVRNAGHFEVDGALFIASDVQGRALYSFDDGVVDLTGLMAATTFYFTSNYTADDSEGTELYLNVMNVSAVPVPAAGFLLLGGLGGLAAMKRRKKKAA